ncbi:MAG TPA: M67 family metallopeptidase [Rhizomicrobium sp.]
MTALDLPLALRVQIEKAASAAFPYECCGLIEGVFEDDRAVITAIHPTRNLSTDADRFEIDPAQHIQLLRSLRGTGRAIVGCYHSHPNGKAEPSVHDRMGAAEEGFIWLVCGTNGSHAQIGAFVFEKDLFRALKMNETASA